MAQAQTRTPVVTHRQHIQDRRINHGVRSGQLTRNEARHMRTDERKISRDKRMARVDGHVSIAERRHLRHEENRTSQAIYRHKHNERIR
jgi:hypothetical protein